MNALSILGITGPLAVNDWFMLLIVAVSLLMLLIMAPFRDVYTWSVSSMFRFKNPDGEVHYPPYPPFVFVLVSILACLSMGVALILYIHDMSAANDGIIINVLIACIPFVTFFAVKLLLYHLINTILSNRQDIMLKPTRWNGFFVMVFSVAGFVMLLVSVLTLFLDITPYIIPICALLILLQTEIGLIFKLKTALFKNKCSTMGFILYLCALEFGPIALMLVILGKTISSI